jgi:hypothetical protein
LDIQSATRRALFIRVSRRAVLTSRAPRTARSDDHIAPGHRDAGRSARKGPLEHIAGGALVPAIPRSLGCRCFRRSVRTRTRRITRSIATLPVAYRRSGPCIPCTIVLVSSCLRLRPPGAIVDVCGPDRGASDPRRHHVRNRKPYRCIINLRCEPVHISPKDGVLAAGPRDGLVGGSRISSGGRARETMAEVARLRAGERSASRREHVGPHVELLHEVVGGVGVGNGDDHRLVGETEP